MSNTRRQIFNDSIVFVDFSCYFDQYQTLCMKECYIVSLSLNRFGRPVDKHFIYIEPDDYFEWPRETQIAVAEYYERYGIPLDKGRHMKRSQRKHFREYLKPAKLIYVQNLERRRQLKLLIGNDLEIKCLSVLGYRPTDNEFVCEWHDFQKKNKCAKGRGISMCTWYATLAVSEQNRQQSNESQSIVRCQSIDQLPLKKRKFTD